jgi:peptidoglycan/xylan/chitin deacetylase (PgdA/CDA1 family)
MAVPILMYHALEAQRSAISLSPKAFAAQMARLNALGYSTWTLSQLLAALQSDTPLPKRTVVITFDDGFASVYEVAFPTLQRYGFTATVFLVSDYGGLTNDWPGQPSRIPRLPLLTWAQVAEMAAAGIEFGSHTCTHPYLDELVGAEISAEIKSSQTTLQQHLRRPISVFAYPYGRFNTDAEQLVRRTYTGACTTELGVVTATTDPYRLPRIEMAYMRHRLAFATLSHQRLLQWYLSARNTFRKIKDLVDSRS